MDKKQPSRLKRPRYTMPEIVRKALLEKDLMEAYHTRPPYQQNDYIGWITRAKMKPTQQKRLVQMLDELARGDRYMKMSYQPKRLNIKKTGRSAHHDGENAADQRRRMARLPETTKINGDRRC